MVIEFEFFDICLSDFNLGGSLACCIFINGRYGLIDLIGWIVWQDFVYIGDFVNGIVCFSFSG